MSGDVLKRMARMVAEAWPEAKPYRRDQFGEFNLERTLNGVKQRCSLYTMNDPEIRVSLTVTLIGAPEYVLFIGLRASKPPLVGLDESAIVAYAVKLATDLDSPAKIRKVTLEEATQKTSRFAKRVPFAALVGMHFQARVVLGQDVSKRLVDSMRQTFELAHRDWNYPDIAAQENGGWEDQPHLYIYRVESAALAIVIDERNRLRAQVKQCQEAAGSTE